jgi:hypothetical protein
MRPRGSALVWMRASRGRTGRKPREPEPFEIEKGKPDSSPGGEPSEDVVGVLDCPGGQNSQVFSLILVAGVESCLAPGPCSAGRPILANLPLDKRLTKARRCA